MADRVCQRRPRRRCASARLTGWGRIAPSTAQLAEPADPAQVAGLLAGAAGRAA